MREPCAASQVRLASRQAASMAMICTGAPVVVVGKIVVVPCSACAFKAVRTAGTVASMKSAPAPP